MVKYFEKHNVKVFVLNIDQELGENELKMLKFLHFFNKYLHPTNKCRGFLHIFSDCTHLIRLKQKSKMFFHL